MKTWEEGQDRCEGGRARIMGEEKNMWTTMKKNEKMGRIDVNVGGGGDVGEV